MIVADVRCGADGGDAVGFCLLGHRHGVGEIAGAVVEPGEKVAVEIDGSVNRTIIDGQELRVPDQCFPTNGPCLSPEATATAVA